MDRNDDDLLVDLDDLTLDPAGEKPAPVTKAETPAREPAKDPAIDPEVVSSLRKQIDQLQAETQSERAGRLAAEEAAAKNARLAAGAAQHAQASRHQLVEGYVKQANARAEQIKGQIKQALEAGDYTAVSNLQIEAATVAARRMQYEDTLADLNEKAQHRPDPEPVRTAPADPFEDAIKNLSGPSQQWLRSHKECITDEIKNAEVLLADKMARRQGMKADTPEYFQFIEERMGYRQKAPEPVADATDDGVEIVDAKPVPRTSMPSAPVSRDSRPNGKSSNPSQYRLSRAEVEMAQELGMTPTEYAKYKIEADREGRYQNN